MAFVGKFDAGKFDEDTFDFFTSASTISAKAKILTLPKTRHKLNYKLYQPDGTFIKNLEQENIISKFSINKTINSGIGALTIILKKPIDNYDEYDSAKNPNGSIKYGNRIKVFLNNNYNTDKQLFYGYLVSIGPNYSNGKESVELTFYGATAKLKNDYFRDYTTPVDDPIDFYVKYVSGATPPEKAPANPSEIIKDIIDNYDGGVSNGMLTYTWGTTIDDCGGTDVEYTFDRVKHYDALRKIQEFLPSTWYWFVNGEGKVYVKNSVASTQHKLIIGRHITEIKSHKTIQDVINYFILWNGRSTADLSYIYATKEDATSKSNYGTKTLFQVDSQVLSDAVATIRKDKVIAYRKDPKEEITIEITDAYDIANIEPGHRVSIRNLRDDIQTTFADDLVVKRISYKLNSALLELGAVGSDLTRFTGDENNAFEEALNQIQTFNYDLQSGNLALTEANIEFGGASFIKQNIIYAPIIAGTTGYFKESIRMGDSGVGSVIRTYGKTAFNNAVAGIWIEKTSAEAIKFELYKDVNNYLRFNTVTGKLEIAGDIVLSAGSSIIWSQISDASVPNTDVLSSFNNDDGWTDDTEVVKLKNGNITAGTFITGTSIASPTITGGVIQTSTSGKRVKMYSDKIEIYNASNILVGTIEGGGTTGIFDIIGLDTIGAVNAFAINTDGLVAMDTGDLALSTRKNGGGGGDIKLIPETTKEIIAFRPIIPNSDFALSVGDASKTFYSMFAEVYYFCKSGYADKYLIRSTNGIDCNTNFYVGGALSKASGSFKIDHPLKPKTHWLEHSFVESPDMLNLYTGNAQIKNGVCKIKMPNWFIALNGKNQDEFTYQLTSIGQLNNLWVKQEMNNKGEVIFAGKKDGKFSYIITAIRHDKWAEKHRVKVESKKNVN